MGLGRRPFAAKASLVQSITTYVGVHATEQMQPPTNDASQYNISAVSAISPAHLKSNNEAYSLIIVGKLSSRIHRLRSAHKGALKPLLVANIMSCSAPRP